ncbi:MAG: 5-formyltetrahydrofolate cyclo-ligase [Haloechinothrix sp.]
MSGSDAELPSKTEWRARVLAERATVAVGVHLAEARALAKWAGSLSWARAGRTVCCYLPFGSEPGSLGVLDALTGAGARVLLPVVPTARGPLEWAAYTGPSALVSGRLPGLLEPSGPLLDPATLADAALVLVPALAVDNTGVRLGRGAGYYDRSLPLASPEAELVAVVRDTELVPKLPAEEHDVRMTGVITPGNGLVRLPR